ncbi:MAG: serine hydrolase domain-containing protein [Anaerolineales bacterium]
MIKRILRWTAYLLIFLAAFFVGISLYFAVAYSPQYVLRLLRWGNSDVGDMNRFPARAIAPSDFVRPLQEAAPDPRAVALLQELTGEQDLQDYLEGSGTFNLLILEGDTPLVEAYANGSSREALVTSFSAAKSFGSTLIGLAIADGYIGSVDDAIGVYLPELPARDPRFTAITIRDLLRMSSGIRYREFPFYHGDDALTYYYPDLRWLALNHTQIEAEPGEFFLYNNYHPLLLGLILERATGKSVAEYLEMRLWQPMEAEYPASWSLDSEQSGFEKMESGLNARAVDFARFGLLVLQDGLWEGQQIIPSEWLQAATAEDLSLDRSSYYPPDFWETPESRLFYGYMWWGYQRAPGRPDFSALGKYGQYIYVSPQADLVFVRNGSTAALPGGEAWPHLFFEFATRWMAP